MMRRGEPIKTSIYRVIEGMCETTYIIVVCVQWGVCL